MHGSLDVITSPDAEKALIEQIDKGEKSIVLDLSKLDYVSSAGIRMFLAILKRVKTAGGQARFCGLIKPVKQVFDIAGLSFRVPLFGTLDEALRGFPPEAPAAPASR
jgi:anti-anti-sigma factor